MSSVEVSHNRGNSVSPSGPFLAAETVGKRYGFQQVLRNVSLSFQSGEIVLLLGANGAGKSTLLRVLSGLARADTGRVVRPHKGLVGFASHHTFLYGRLSVRENLSLYRALASDERASIDDLLGAWDLVDVASKPICELSKGNQTRASLARAFLGAPPLVLLDEPSSNLDQRSTDYLRQTIKRHATSGLVIIATHDIHRLREIATRIVVMERGGVLADSGVQSSADAIDAVIHRYMESNR